MKKFFFVCFLFLCSEIFSVSLPTGFRGIVLGMSFDEVEAILQKDFLFGYRGQRDISLLPTDNRLLIETKGNSFLSQCSFQFYEDKLYTIILTCNPQKMDYYSLYQTMSDKYGQENYLDTEKIVWENESVIISLERPVSMKYVDKKVFEGLKKSEEVQKTGEEILRKQFLESF
ncbi:MAG: hypothetical protein E7062_00610 [Spirochaetaceae bacterium]|nr:hypothetical protein [Spirochaetaceae bacterium]